MILPRMFQRPTSFPVPSSAGLGRAGVCAAALLALILAASVPPEIQAGEGVALRRILPGEAFRQPVHLTALPDGSGDLVVVEQAGVIRRFSPRARKGSRVFLDIRQRVSTDGGEEGLLSVAFHPAYSRNGRFYVYYSARSPRRSVIAAFRAPFTGKGVVDSSLGQPLLEIAQPFGNHNGGQLMFGPDGMLYIGLGDGGSGGDPFGNGQNLRTLLGSILRIDVNRRDAGKAYAVPPDNPFVGDGDGVRGEIWAYGLRNPWRFSFDRLTGGLFAADVGQNSLEEVDIIVKGGNYGWNHLEGSQCYHPSNGCRRRGLIPPIAEYGRAAGQSITGGFVYRGRALPALRGQYLFADYSSGALWSIPAAGGQTLRRMRRLLSTGLNISAFGEDRAGELYVLDHRRGNVFQLIPAP